MPPPHQNEKGRSLEQESDGVVGGGGDSGVDVGAGPDGAGVGVDRLEFFDPGVHWLER